MQIKTNINATLAPPLHSTLRVKALEEPQAPPRLSDLESQNLQIFSCFKSPELFFLRATQLCTFLPFMSFFTPFETGNWKAIITHMCHILGKGEKNP
jgi:hypothetical protein